MLITRAAEVDVSEETFWTMTPRQLSRVFQAHANVRRREQRRDIELAWHTAALTRTAKLPTLKSLTKRLDKLEEPRRRDKKPSSWQDITAGLETWMAASGGKATAKKG